MPVLLVIHILLRVSGVCLTHTCVGLLIAYLTMEQVRSKGKPDGRELKVNYSLSQPVCAREEWLLRVQVDLVHVSKKLAIRESCSNMKGLICVYS